MFRPWKTLLLLPVVLTALVLASGCETDVTTPRDLAAPEAVLAEQGDTTVLEAGEYTLVQGRLPADLPEISVSRVIDAGGGSLNLAGHRLEVPAGAVSGPVLFVMQLGADGYVDVKLSAIHLKRSLLGLVLGGPVEEFEGSVTLSLSYAWARDVDDPADLFIGKSLGDGTLLRLPTRLSDTGPRISVDLEDFSRYCMATT